jgi:CRP-like cAMP-binding protein
VIYRNGWLESLPSDIFGVVRRYLGMVTLVSGERLWRMGDRVRQVYFPVSGTISLVVELKDGDAIETAMLGRPNILNASSALNANGALMEALTLVAGQALVADVGPIRKIAQESAEFRSRLAWHEHKLLAHTQQTAACNAHHSIEARTCRWLLRARDLTESDDLGLTHEQLARMLGVRRPGVSLAVEGLQRDGLINYHRGLIRLTDTAGLRGRACECYEAVKAIWDSGAFLSPS